MNGWLVLDVDDTLVATFQTGLAKMRKVAALLGLESPSEAAFAELYGRMSFGDCVRSLHPDVDLSRYQAAYDTLVTRYPAVPLCDGRSLVDAAAGADMRCGILTNGPTGKTTRKLSACGLVPAEFDFVVSGDTAAVRKPHVAAFTALSAFGVEAGTAWFVSDSAQEWEGCESAGLRSVGISTGRPVSTGYLPTVLLPNAAVLPRLVPILAASPSTPAARAPAAVTFDAGFTLIEPLDDPALIICRRLAESGTAPTLAKVHAALAGAAGLLAGPESWWMSAVAAQLTLRRFYEQVLVSLGHPSPAAAGDIIDAYTSPANWRAAPGALDLLATVRAAGLRTGVVSNWQPSLVDVLAATGVAPYVDAVVASTVAGVAKPSRGAFDAAADALGVPVGSVVHVGDQLGDDVLGALRAGCRAVLADGALAGLSGLFVPTGGRCDGQRNGPRSAASRSSARGR